MPKEIPRERNQESGREKEPKMMHEAETFSERLFALDTKYRQYHSIGDNIIYDERLRPRTRVERFLEYIRNNPQLNVSEEEAIELAIVEMEKTGENIAGNWGKVSPEELPISPESKNIEQDIYQFIQALEKRTSEKKGGRRAA